MAVRYGFSWQSIFFLEQLIRFHTQCVGDGKDQIQRSSSISGFDMADMDILNAYDL